MESMERIISWFNGTSFYQRFCVNLPVPFNNAYFDVVFLVILGVAVGWKIVDRIHSLRFRLRIRRKKESVLERQLEQEAKEQERNRQMEAINQNNLLYMQFLQTAMLSHMAISEPAFEAWKREHGFVSPAQVKIEVDPDPETIGEDVEKRRENQKVGSADTGTKDKMENEGIGDIGTVRVEIEQEKEEKKANQRKAEQKKMENGKVGDGSSELKEERTEGEEQIQKRRQEDSVIECTDIEQKAGDIPDIEMPVFLEDERAQGADFTEEKPDGEIFTFSGLSLEEDGDSEHGRDEGNTEIPEGKSAFDLLIENMVRRESMNKKQSSMREEADKVISHNISVLDGQIQSALQVENEKWLDDEEKNGEMRQREALEAERRRIEKEGSKKHFWRKKDGD